MRRFIILLFILLFPLGLATATSAATLGTMTPPQLETLLQNNKGKIVFINFFATWCPPCRAEIPDLLELRKKYSEDQVTMIGISLDQDQDKLETFVQKMEFTYPVYRSDNYLPELYSISSIPHNVIYLPSGELAHNAPGIIPGNELDAIFNSILKEQQ